jgi:hypothetical protein
MPGLSAVKLRATPSEQAPERIKRPTPVKQVQPVHWCTEETYNRTNGNERRNPTAITATPLNNSHTFWAYKRKDTQKLKVQIDSCKPSV